MHEHTHTHTHTHTHARARACTRNRAHKIDTCLALKLAITFSFLSLKPFLPSIDAQQEREMTRNLRFPRIVFAMTLSTLKITKIQSSLLVIGKKCLSGLPRTLSSLLDTISVRSGRESGVVVVVVPPPPPPRGGGVEEGGTR